MSLPRIFIPTNLSPRQEVSLDISASHHIVQVLRLRLNDSLLVFNNSGGEFNATITSITKQQTLITLGEFRICNNESPLAIHLGQGISRGERMDFTIQKSVELGVSSITPLFTEHCNVSLNEERLEKRLQHWQQVAISAAEQSGRCYVPKILPAQTLAAWCGNTVAGLRLLLDPYAVDKLGGVAKRPDNVTILVGPEGGFSVEEIKIAKQEGFLPIALGPRILRTETAALTIISMLQAKWGDF